ncbi:hypothetical protein ASPZODRAFT_74951, partial [Penicilliopsis zonata CBS 506.65]
MWNFPATKTTTSTSTPAPSSSDNNHHHHHHHHHNNDSNSTINNNDNIINNNPPTTSTSDNNGSQGGHRSISPQFSVNPVNGTMSLSLPIHTTAGRSGFGPQLSLSYDSGNGNGPFGVGWQMSMMGVGVSRKVSKGIPRYDDSDVFLLSGLEDLVPLGTPTLVGAHHRVQQYRPRVESEKKILRIERWTRIDDDDDDDDGDDVHWRTISAENETTFYGETDESRIMEREGKSSRIFFWLISRTVDALGNAIHFEYKAENAEGLDELDDSRSLCETLRPAEARTRVRYLKRILYGNCQPSRDLDTWNIIKLANNNDDDDDDIKNWLFEVVFDYGDHDAENPTPAEQQAWEMRAAPYSTCCSGFELRYYRLCQRVLMFHHFPRETGRSHALVASTRFQYTESNGVTLIQSVITTGSLPATATRKTGEGYYHESLPPVEFEYTPALEVDRAAALEIQELPRDTLHQMSSSGVGWTTEWVDLDGEGMPGVLLIIENGAWWYQRNELPKTLASSDCSYSSLGPLRQLHLQPQGGGGQHYLEDLEHTGHMDVVFMDAMGVPTGFFERTPDGEWAAFQSMTSVPQLSLSDQSTKRVDLTGNGLPDLLHQEPTGCLVWYECLGKAGYASARPVVVGKSSSSTLDHPPCLVSPDAARIGTYLADMTGDGLSDLVEVRQGRVVYWPNHVHGQFGAPVLMGHSPIFTEHGEFSPARLRLAGVFGSGTTDLIYLPPSGGIHVYFNEAGNRWSERMVIPQVPALTDSDIASVFMLDLLGCGTTSCLCWNDRDRGTLRFVNLAAGGGGGGGTKPHLMAEYRNGIGATTAITYQPSTHYYLADEEAGTPWTSRLSFPVHCVSRVTMHDHIAQTARSSRYAYHNGRYDGVEREFRGFGVVEHWDEELFGGTGDQTTAAAAAATYLRRSPIHTKQWYHTGAANDTDNNNLHNAWHRSQGAAGHKLPPNLAQEEEQKQYEVHRALKGQKLREEVYSDDGSPRAAIPYCVTEFSHQVICCNDSSRSSSTAAGIGIAGTGKGPGCYRVVPRESVKTLYEREEAGTPRIEREMVLQIDSYGNVLKSLTITHGRPSAAAAAEGQAVSWGVYMENTMTNDVNEIHCFQAPQLAATRRYAVRGLTDSQITDLDGLAAADCALLRTIEEVPYNTPNTTDGLCKKSLVQETRQYFFDGRLCDRLDLGVIEAFSMLDQSYELALTGEILHTNFVSTGLLDIKMLPTTLAQAGYVRLDNDDDDDRDAADDDRWWTPSERKEFATDESNRRLELARRSFYLPTVVVDVFGNRTTQVLDAYYHLPVEIIDAEGHTIRFRNDYWHVQPCEITDINGNRLQVALDAFGSTVGMAQLGKTHEQQLGDSLEGFAAIVTPEELEAFIQNPTGEISTRLLAGAGQRTLYYPGRYYDHAAQDRVVPPFTADISCDTYGRERTANAALTVAITYLDGAGKPLQTTTLCIQDLSSEQWRISEWTIHDSRGNPVRICQPSFAADHHFRFEANIDSPKTTKLMDPLDRVIGVLNADHTWSKVRHTPWGQVAYDAGATLRIDDPALDEDAGSFFRCLERSEYFPSWLQRHPAQLEDPDVIRQCDVYATKRAITHLDARGQVILQEMELGDGQVLRLRREYDGAGHAIVQYDAAQRLAQRVCYDMQSRPISTKMLDAGDTTVLLDCMGQPLLRWNQLSIRFRHVYDSLRREREMWMKDDRREDEEVKEVLLHRITYDSHRGPQSAALNRRGKISVIEDQSGRLEYTHYDFRGQCVRQECQMAQEYRNALDWRQPVALEPRRYVSRATFDALGREIEAVDPTGCVTTRAYDLTGNLRALSARAEGQSDPVPLVVEMRYSPDKLVLHVRYGNGVRLHQRYDRETRRMLQKTLLRGGVASQETIQDVQYRYDCMGRLIWKSDVAQASHHFRNSRTDPTWTFAYDALGQLVEATGREQLNARNGGGFHLLPHQPQGRPSPTGKIGETCQYRERYRYDNVGNMLAMHHEAVNMPSVAGWTRRFEYAEASNLQPGVMGNRLSFTRTGRNVERYQYDSDRGCMTGMAGYSELTWDHLDQLRSSSRQQAMAGIPERTWYVYNMAGIRVRKVTERGVSRVSAETTSPQRLKETIFVSGVDICRKYRGDGQKVRETTQNNILGDMGTPGPRQGRDSLLIRYQSGDNLELDDGGRLLSYEEYTPFGTTILYMGVDQIKAPRRYRFAAYERDHETGLCYCHRRYYAPWLGRWTSVDPLGTVDGPNLYRYVANDPVNKHDPSGT